MKRVLKYYEVKTLKIALIIVILTIISYVAAYALHTKGHEWIQNAILGVSGGLVAGLVVYFLTNIRNSEISKLERDYTECSKVYKGTRDLIFQISAYKKTNFVHEEDDIEELYKIANQYYDMIENIMCMPEDLFDKMQLEEEYWGDISLKQTGNYDFIESDYSIEAKEQFVDELYRISQTLSDIIKNMKEENYAKKKLFNKNII